MLDAAHAAFAHVAAGSLAVRAVAREAQRRRVTFEPTPVMSTFVRPPVELCRYETRELEPEIEMRSTVLVLIRAPAPVTTIDRHRPVIVTRTSAPSTSTTCLLDVQWTGGLLPGVEIVMVDADAIAGTTTATATTMSMMGHA